MSAPFLNTGIFDLDLGLVIAVIIGFGFGFTLERAGFGSSRKLAAQFYLYDMTVYKVMFTAIITAMIGLFGLAKIGFLDLDLTYINPTFLWPQIAGGVLLGFGFIMSGYCPGTAIVASASGKIDGLLTLAGVTAGIFIFGMVYSPGLAEFHTSGSMGRLLLSDIFGMEPMLLAVLIVIGAVASFIMVEWVEGLFKQSPESLGAAARRNKVGFAFLAAVVLISFVFLLQPIATRSVIAAEPVEESITPLALARLIVEGNNNFVVVDIREKPAEEEIIPGSISFEPSQLQEPGFWRSTFPQHKRIFIVTADGPEDATVSVPSNYRVAWLKGGFSAWQQEILTEPGDVTTQEDRERLALYSYFTGAASKAPKPKVAAPAFIPEGGKKKKKVSGGC